MDKRIGPGEAGTGPRSEDLKESMPGPSDGVVQAGPGPREQFLPQGVRKTLKGFGNAVGFALVALPAFLCKLESWLDGQEQMFTFWAQVMCLVPGLPGEYLRRCYYYLTLEAGSLTCSIGFLSRFSHRQVRIGARVYIGTGTTIGKATLGDGALIGSRVSILSGGHQHRFGADGKLTAFDLATVRPVQVGEETWVGEGAILLNDVGNRCIVAAGCVVSNPVPDGCIVGGNPARFIGKTLDSAVAVRQESEA